MRRTLAIVIFGLGISVLFPSASDAQWLKVGEIQAGEIYALAVNGDRLYAATDEGLFASSDGGTRWSLPSRELSGIPVFDLAVKDRQIHAATTDRGVFVSADNGTSWRLASSGLARPRSIVLGSSISGAVMGEKRFLGTDTGVFMSLDGGETWAIADAGLLDSSYIESLAVIGDTLFVLASLDGVFLTKNDGEDWDEVNDGLPVDLSETSDGSEVLVNCLGAIGDTPLAGTQDGVFRLDSSQGELRWVRSGLQDKDVADLVVVGAVVFAGADDGGVFRSEDAGETWVSSSTGLPEASVEVLASGGDGLFVGTSDNGIFVSTNGGRDWTEFNSGIPRQTVDDIGSLVVVGDRIFAIAGEDILVSPVSVDNWTSMTPGVPGAWDIHDFAIIGSDVYAATSSSGVIRSGPDRSSFSTVDPREPRPSDHVLSLGAIGERLFAGTLNHGVMVSSDGGAKWEELDSALSTSNVNSFFLDAGVFFAGTDEGVFRSEDGGGQWTKVTSRVAGLDGTEIESLTTIDTHLFALTWDGLFSLPGDASEWMAIGSPLIGESMTWESFIEAHSGMLFVVTPDRLFRSADRGQSWVAIDTETAGFSDTDITALESIGSDLVAGTTAGVYLSTDHGSHWTQVNPELFGSIRVKDLAVAGKRLFVLTGSDLFMSTDHGERWVAVETAPPKASYDSLFSIDHYLFLSTHLGLFRSVDFGSTWMPVNSGLGHTPSVYAVAATGTDFFAATEDGVFRSSNGGETWVGVLSAEYSSMFQSLEAVENRVFAGTWDGVFTSSDRGETWTPMSSGLPLDLGVRSFARSGPHLFAGTDKGVIRSADHGSTWGAVNAGLPPGLAVDALVARGSALFAGAGFDGVFRSLDGGSSWVPVNTGLPVGDIYFSVRSLATSDDTIFAGTGFGVYRSSDQGETWAPSFEGMDESYPGVQALAVVGADTFAGTDEGAYVSNDQGDTWRPVSSASGRVMFLGELAVMGDDLLVATGETVLRFKSQPGVWATIPRIPLASTLGAVEVLGDDLFAVAWSGGVYRLSDGEDSWTPSSSGLRYSIITDLVAGDTHLYALVDEHGVSRSQDNGRTWTRANFGLPDYFSATSILIGTKALYLAVGHEIYTSEDQGDSWTMANPAWPVKSRIRGFAEVGDCLFAGTTDGLFRSCDGDTSWEEIDHGLPSGFQLRTLVVDDADLLAAGDGGAVWRLPSACD